MASFFNRNSKDYISYDLWHTSRSRNSESARAKAAKSVHVGARSVSSRTSACANLRQLYTSKDGGLCLFECEGGHLAAVKASRLA